MARKRRTKRVHLEDGEWHRPVLHGHMEECCDCGLVHTVDYKITKENNHFVLKFRATVDRKATAAARRKFHFAKE